MRAHDLATPFYGVRMRRPLPDDIVWACAAYQKRMHPEHVFSHATAAQLYGLPMPLYADRTSPLHVSTPAPLRPPQCRGVIGHEVAEQVWDCREILLRDEPTAQLFAFRVCSPTLLWAQLASTLDTDDLVALGDAIVTPMSRPGLLDDPVLATIDELRTTAALHVGRRGAKAMTAAVGRIRSGPLSRPESLLRLMLVRAGVPEPQLNVAVADASGHDVAIADLSWPQFRVLIEYEGDYHRRSTAKFRSDVRRGERYADADWFQIRAYADDVFTDPGSLIARVSKRLVARGWRPKHRERGQIVAARR